MNESVGPPAPAAAVTIDSAPMWKVCSDLYAQLLLQTTGLRPNDECRARENPAADWQRARVRRTDNISVEDLRKLTGARMARVKVASGGSSRNLDVPMAPELLRAPLPEELEVARAKQLSRTEEYANPNPFGGNRLTDLEREVDQLRGTVQSLETRLAAALAAAASATAVEAMFQKLEARVLAAETARESADRRIAKLWIAVAGGNVPNLSRPASPAVPTPHLTIQTGQPVAQGAHVAALASGQTMTQSPVAAEPAGPVYSGRKLVRADISHSWGADDSGKKMGLLFFEQDQSFTAKTQRFNQARGRPRSALIRPEDVVDFLAHIRATNPNFYPPEPGEIHVALEEALSKERGISTPRETKAGGMKDVKNGGKAQSQSHAQSKNHRKRPRVEEGEEQQVPRGPPHNRPPKGSNKAFIEMFNRGIQYLGANPPEPLPGPLSAPATADGVPWLWYVIGGTFQDGMGHSQLDEHGKTIPESAPRCPQDKVQAEAWYRAILDRQWESPGAIYNLGILVEDRDTLEAERLYSEALRLVELYRNEPCTFDFTVDNGRVLKNLQKRLAKVRKRLGMTDDSNERLPAASRSTDSERTVVNPPREKSPVSDAEGTVDDEMDEEISWADSAGANSVEVF